MEGENQAAMEDVGMDPALQQQQQYMMQ